MKERTSDSVDKKLLDDIHNYGWHVVKVLEDDKRPGFAYSVGFFKTFNHPEIIVVGLKLDLAHILINNMGDDIKRGKYFQAGLMHAEILDHFNCLLADVKRENYKTYVGFGLWYYDGDRFPLMQCIYPTVNGIYPWEKDWPEDLKDLQPILGDIGHVSK